jgi:hypothetical protein
MDFFVAALLAMTARGASHHAAPQRAVIPAKAGIQ